MITIEAASVSDLVLAIKDTLEGEFGEVYVQGEISNLSFSASGHWYFTLSDDTSSISCALFRLDASRNPIIKNLKDGDKIAVIGGLSVYQKKGTFQIIARKVIPAGEGQLKIQLERLKAKLAAEGLFDIAAKKSIPSFPGRIAVITAEHGAALQDFLNVYKRRCLWCDILIFPALVQGEAAPASVIKALRKANEHVDIDLIVITRGGGSLEDLWAFNDEALVREVAASNKPVISAVGHEVDFTLCDYVSDLRCETPTAAAEVLTQPQTELKARIYYCFSHLKAELFKSKQKTELWLHRFNPAQLIRILEKKIETWSHQLDLLKFSTKAAEVIPLQEYAQNLDDLISKMQHAMELKFKAVDQQLVQQHQVLIAVNPERVLQRGFCFVEQNGKLINSKSKFNEMKSGEEIRLNFFDGVANVIKK